MMALSHVLPFERTFFRTVAVPRGTALSDQMVRLNYGHLSPYPNGGLAYVRRGDALLLWFYPETESPARRVPIPEAYLHWRNSKAQGDAILLAPRAEGVAYVAIRKGELVGQALRPHPADSPRTEEDLSLLAREHSLADPKLVRVDAGSKPRAGLGDVAAFSHADWSPERVLRTGWQMVQAPVLIALAILAGYQVFLSREIGGTVAQLEGELARLEKATAPVKSDLEVAEARAAFWTHFREEELSAPAPGGILEHVTKTVGERSGELQRIRYGPDRLQIWGAFPRERIDGLVEALVAHPAFQKVNVRTNRETRDRPQWRSLEMEILLRLPEAVAGGIGEEAQ
jgi:hypothetical protein